MYAIDTDMTIKLVSVEIRGTFDTGEIITFLTELEEIINHFGKKEASVLMLLDRMDPVAQENLPLMIKSLSAEAEHIRKIANVQGKVVTRMQMRRIENEVNKLIIGDLEVGKFDNKRDALEYLLS